MKVLKKVEYKDLQTDGWEWVMNAGGLCSKVPTDQANELKNNGWGEANPREVVYQFIKHSALNWKLNVAVPNFERFGLMQGYTNFAKSLEIGLNEYGVDFSPSVTEKTDLILIINSVWAGANTGQIKSFKELNKPVAMFTMFESTKWIDTHVKELEEVDFLIVPCKWNKDTLIKQGFSKPIYICPLPNTIGFHHVIRPEKRKKFTFFHYNAMDPRKGFPEYIDAFFNEFEPHEDVKLILKSRENDHSNTNFSMFDKRLGGKNREMIWYRKNMTTEEILLLHQESDCFVFPSKGEGWGYPPIEALISGNPVVIPNKHAFKDFFNKKACLEVGTTMEPATFSINAVEQKGVGNWYKPKLEDIQKQMRFVYEQWKLEGRKAEIFMGAEKYGAKIADKYSGRNVAKIFIDILEKNKIAKLHDS